VSTKASDSAFQSHSNKSSGLPASGGGGPSNKSSANTRSRKDEEAVLKLFGNQRHHKKDEFTDWCTEALSKFQSSIDVPTFFAFLKDVESPFDVNDYVRSYLGESKETREFAKQFVEKRSFYRNRAKKEASEELMWGPAPAITPSANKAPHSVGASSNPNGEADAAGLAKAGKKKKKGKRVDSSILGFTVQADPDRINAGEIEQLDE
jgi:PERQ amino acid-rich with GYF domain-containing protein